MAIVDFSRILSKEMIGTQRIVITGGTGFIGSHLSISGSNTETKLIDRYLLSESAILADEIQGADVIVHLAALTKGADVVNTNLDLTKNILDAISCSKSSPLLIFSSSFAVYGVQSGLLNEDSRISPRNDYGISKMECEKLIHEYVAEYAFPAVNLRLANVYGPGMPPYAHSVVSSFFAMANENKPFSINGNGEQERDFVFVDDVVDAIGKVILLNSKWDGVETINICSGVGTSMNDLANKVNSLLGARNQILYPNPAMVEEGYWIGNNRKAGQILGWGPTTSLDDGLEACSYDFK